ncbi:hypothetical protein ASG90_08435 [Nocardioides sp. Soil797]|nr:hypothetical protein ASG90_08435 [Nocardioides sp. Soil797]
MPASPHDLTISLYRLARRHRDWDRAQLAEVLGITVDELETAGKELQQLGLVLPGDSWTAVEPMHAAQQLLQQHGQSVAAWSESAARLAVDIDAMAALLPELRVLAEDDAQNTVLEGNETARQFLAELGHSLQRELLTVHSGGALSQEAIDAALPQDLAVLERGVEVRTVYLSSAVRSLPTLRYLEQLSEAGAQVRIRDTLPFRMVLADGATAVCSMKWAEGRSGAVVVRGSTFTQLLRRVFDFCWAEATPMGAFGGRSSRTTGDDLDDEQRLMLRLFHDGLTDQAIARQLGVAPRTFTRKLRILFEQLEVESRFQAGVEAVRRGLV